MIKQINTKDTKLENLISNWNNYLEKTAERLTNLLLVVETAVWKSAKTNQFNLDSIEADWQRFKQRLEAVTDEIEETWGFKVQHEIMQQTDHKECIVQQNKGFLIREKMLKQIERFEILLLGKLAESIYFKENNKDQETLDFVAEKMAYYDCIQEWDDKEYKEALLYDLEDEKTIEQSIAKLEVSFIVFWTKWLKKRMSINPRFKSSFDLDLEEKRKTFLKWKYLYL